MTIQEYIQSREEEFGTIFDGSSQQTLNHAKSFHSETITKLIEMIREICKKKMQPENYEQKINEIKIKQREAYNQALDDILSQLPNSTQS